MTPAPLPSASFARYLRGLPPYPGSKRRLVPAILSLIGTVVDPAGWPELVFADAFSGAGSVSLASKIAGFGVVHANDLSERCAVVARAVIANSSRRLSVPEVLHLFAPTCPGSARPAIADRLSKPAADFFARAHSHLHCGHYSGAAP